MLPDGTVEFDAKQLVIKTLFIKTMLYAPKSAGIVDISHNAWSVAWPRISRSLVLTRCRDQQESRRRKYSVFAKLGNYYDDKLAQAYHPKFTIFSGTTRV